MPNASFQRSRARVRHATIVEAVCYRELLIDQHIALPWQLCAEARGPPESLGPLRRRR